MKTYQYYSSQLKADIQRTYNKHGILTDVTIVNGNELQEVSVDNISLSLKLSDFLERSKKHGVKVTEVVRNITFEEFWKDYPEKQGGRTVAQKKWNNLSKADQLEAYDYLKVFVTQLKLKGTACPYAQTYFNQKRWIK